MILVAEVFHLLRSKIGLENSRYFLNQSTAKLKHITTWSPHVFPRVKQVFSFYFEFSLVNEDVNLGSDFSAVITLVLGFR